MKNLLIVMAGSALGGGARYVTSELSARSVGAAFPFATIGINVVGSFLLVLVMQVSLTSSPLSPETRLFVTTGVLGGFTTYSSFNYEAIKLIQEGTPLLGILNVAATVILCLSAGALAVFVARLAT